MNKIEFYNFMNEINLEQIIIDFEKNKIFDKNNKEIKTLDSKQFVDYTKVILNLKEKEFRKLRSYIYKLSKIIKYFDLKQTTEIYKEDVCIICLTNEPKISFTRCGHLCLCKKCSRNDFEWCPMCKQ